MMSEEMEGEEEEEEEEECNSSGLGWLACEYQIYCEIVYCS